MDDKRARGSESTTAAPDDLGNVLTVRCGHKVGEKIDWKTRRKLSVLYRVTINLGRDMAVE